MDAEEKIVVVVITIIVLSITIGVQVATHIAAKHGEEMARLGYEEVAAPGMDTPIWKKVRS